MYGFFTRQVYLRAVSSTTTNVKESTITVPSGGAVRRRLHIYSDWLSPRMNYSPSGGLMQVSCQPSHPCCVTMIEHRLRPQIPHPD